jgi:hypothetical protein
MSAIDDMTGLLGIAVAAGVVTKVTQSMFPAPQQQQYQSTARRPKRGKRSTRRTTNGTGFGNFQNVGLF